MTRNEMMAAAKPIPMLAMAILWIDLANPCFCSWLILLDMKNERFKGYC
jgi:hypothetical protein